MPAAHTRTSHWATIATILLVLVQLVHLLSGHHEAYIDVLLATLVLSTAAAGVKLHRDNSLEARFAVTFLAASSGGGMLVTLCVGLPGHEVTPLGPLETLTLVMSASVLGLLVADQARRVGRRVRTPGRPVRLQHRSPYAS